MNKYSPFEDYLKWDRENVIHLEGMGLFTKQSDGRVLRVGGKTLVKNKIKIKTSCCPHCGAPINPYEIKCEYCECYYVVD